MGWLFNSIIRPNIINYLRKMEKRLMSAITDIKDEVSAQKTVVESVVTLLEGLHAKLEAAGTDQFALDEIKSSLAENTKKLADAVAANTVAHEENQ